MKFSRNLPFHTRRDAWVEVDLSAIEHNAGQVRQAVPPGVEIMSIIKADAYGHGAVMVLHTLEASGIARVGVAAMDEALQIREAGFTLPVLVLGVTPDWSLHYAVENDIEVTVFSQQHVDGLKRVYEMTGIPAKVHIKVDTGMHRIGIDWREAPDFIADCQKLAHLKVEGVFSHLAHTEDEAFTQTQLHRWEIVLEKLETPPPFLHIANSSAIWHYPLGRTNLVRVGLSLFGYASDSLPLPVTLKPAMGLKARIVHLQTLPQGEGVSYNQTYQNVSDTPRTIATLPLGYADGIPRKLSNQIDCLYQGKRLKQVGNITMDQLMVDVTEAPEAQVGDVITLLGPSRDQALWLDGWAQKLDAIEYELMCALRVRLSKTYTR